MADRAGKAVWADRAGRATRWDLNSNIERFFKVFTSLDSAN